MEFVETFPIDVLSFFLMAIIVECGQILTNEFDDFNSELNRCDWYQFPIDIQQMLIIFMANVQQSMTIHGMISCTRESFKEVRIFVFENRH